MYICILLSVSYAVEWFPSGTFISRKVNKFFEVMIGFAQITLNYRHVCEQIFATRIRQEYHRRVKNGTRGGVNMYTSSNKVY